MFLNKFRRFYYKNNYSKNMLLSINKFACFQRKYFSPDNFKTTQLLFFIENNDQRK